jgi:hypothetical protein
MSNNIPIFPHELHEFLIPNPYLRGLISKRHYADTRKYCILTPELLNKYKDNIFTFKFFISSIENNNYELLVYEQNIITLDGYQQDLLNYYNIINNKAYPLKKLTYKTNIPALTPTINKRSDTNDKKIQSYLEHQILKDSNLLEDIWIKNNRQVVKNSDKNNENNGMLPKFITKRIMSSVTINGCRYLEVKEQCLTGKAITVTIGGRLKLTDDASSNIGLLMMV